MRRLHAMLEGWIICPVLHARSVFLAGRVQDDRTGQFPHDVYITSPITSPTHEIIDRKTLNSRYLLSERNGADDVIFAKLDAWLATEPEAPLVWTVIATAMS